MKWKDGDDSKKENEIQGDSDEGYDDENDEEMEAFLKDIDPSIILKNHSSNEGPTHNCMF